MALLRQYTRLSRAPCDAHIGKPGLVRKTIHQLDSYNAKTMLREVEGDDVPAPHFGAIIGENQFFQVASRLKEAGWPFVIPPYKQCRGEDLEHWILVVLDPSGNAIALKSFTKVPAESWA